ncbi:MAG: pseudouridine synthase [Synechococcus sp. MED-G135]|nr:MAG: pseudouridine synthase [Synechococcus sp. MED-G135]
MADQRSTLLLHKPYGVLSQFTPEPNSRWGCLADLVPVPDVYAAGRLDADSEGLLLLTSNGRLQHRLTSPHFGHWRSYWVQVEGEAKHEHLQKLERGLVIQGTMTLPAKAELLEPALSLVVTERNPPIRFRAKIPTSWIALSLREGRNRQVRRMTAAVGLPTLRLIRTSLDLMDGQPNLNLEGLAPGQWRRVSPDEARRLNRLLSSRSAPNPVRHQRG